MSDYQQQEWECYFPSFTSITSLVGARTHQRMDGYVWGKFDITWEYKVYDEVDIDRVILYRYIQPGTGEYVDNTDPAVEEEYVPIYTWNRVAAEDTPPTTYSDQLVDYTKNGLTNQTVSEAVEEIMTTRRALYYRVEVWVNRASFGTAKIFAVCDGGCVRALSTCTQVINNKFFVEGAEVWKTNKRGSFTTEVFLRVAVDLVHDLENHRIPAVWASTSKGGVYCLDYYTGAVLGYYREPSTRPIRAFALDAITGCVIYDAGRQEVRQLGRLDPKSVIISKALPSTSNNVGAVCTVENGKTYFYCISNNEQVTKIGINTVYTKNFGRTRFGCSSKTPANQPNVYGITKGINGAVWVNGHTPLHMYDYEVVSKTVVMWRALRVCAELYKGSMRYSTNKDTIVPGTDGHPDLDARHKILSHNPTKPGHYKCKVKINEEHGETYNATVTSRSGSEFHILQDIGYIYGVTEGVNSWATNGQYEDDRYACSAYKAGAKSPTSANAFYFRAFTNGTSARFPRALAACGRYGWYSNTSGSESSLPNDNQVYKPWKNPFTSVTSATYGPTRTTKPPSSQLGMCCGLPSDGQLYSPSGNTSASDDYDVYATNMGDHAINRLMWIGDTTSAERYDRDRGLFYPTSGAADPENHYWISESEYGGDGVTGMPVRVPSHVAIDLNNNVWGQDIRHGLVWKIYTQSPTTLFPMGGFSTYPSTGYFYTSGTYSYGRGRNYPEVEYALLCSAATAVAPSSMNGVTLTPSAARAYLVANPAASPARLRLYPNYRGSGKTYTMYNVLTATASEREYNSDNLGVGGLMTFGRTILEADYIHPAETRPSGFMYVSAASSFGKTYCDSYDESFWNDRTYIGPASSFVRMNLNKAQYVSGYDDLWTTHVLSVDMGSFVYRWGRWEYADAPGHNDVSAFSTERTTSGKSFTDVNYHFTEPNLSGKPNHVVRVDDRYTVSGYAVSYPNVYDLAGNANTDWYLGTNYVDVAERWPSPKFCISECSANISDQYWDECVPLTLGEVPEEFFDE